MKITSFDPFLVDIFTQQQKMKVSDAFLSRLSGVDKKKIQKMRNPSLSGGGKRPLLSDVRSLAEALDMELTIKPRY